MVEAKIPDGFTLASLPDVDKTVTETPRANMRWVASASLPSKRKLQQLWFIETFWGHERQGCKHEWRDVPEVAE